MDQTTTLSSYDRRRAVDGLASLSRNRSTPRARSRRRSSISIRPRVSRRRLRPNSGAEAGVARLRPMHGRSKGHDLDDGTHTRVKIDLFRNTSQSAAGKRALWDVVGRALCSDKVRQAFIRRLAPGLKKRFGDAFAKVGCIRSDPHPRHPRYMIPPHTDTKWKGITVQLYLPADDANTTSAHLPRAARRRRDAEEGADTLCTEFRLRVCGRHRHLALGRSGAQPRQDARLHPAHLFSSTRACSSAAQPRQAHRQFRAQRNQAAGVAVVPGERAARDPGPILRSPSVVHDAWVPAFAGTTGIALNAP